MIDWFDCLLSITTTCSCPYVSNRLIILNTRDLDHIVRHFGDLAHLTIGDGGLVVQGNPGSEPWRPTCDLWILGWRLRNDALRIDRLGGNSWHRLRRLRHAPEKEIRELYMRHWGSNFVFLSKDMGPQKGERLGRWPGGGGKKRLRTTGIDLSTKCSLHSLSVTTGTVYAIAAQSLVTWGYINEFRLTVFWQNGKHARLHQILSTSK